jgi:peptidylprolyl isomerase
VVAPTAVELATLAGVAVNEPPTVIVRQDVVEGSGDLAEPGLRLTVQYLGIRWSDGGEFDSSWSRGQPFQFTLGAGQVITGWEEGFVGMRVGGRRMIQIPPAFAFGDRGAGSVIGPGETLVFLVDLVAVTTP